MLVYTLLPSLGRKEQPMFSSTAILETMAEAEPLHAHISATSHPFSMRFGPKELYTGVLQRAPRENDLYHIGEIVHGQSFSSISIEKRNNSHFHLVLPDYATASSQICTEASCSMALLMFPLVEE